MRNASKVDDFHQIDTCVIGRRVAEGKSHALAARAAVHVIPAPPDESRGFHGAIRERFHLR
ncbi:hypothetical protein [Pseudoxanthomonas sp. GM95]|uniref:hypothetical protein n=1 Tax=Pseudoxanthomonas sp. GM95 TaxID=1881043 RepID=UPI0011142E38|nr:hypothetical protein [Pseudoxanthomonas sp. GM95]